MSIEKTDAIVLKTVDFMETSLVLTVFTRDLGKVRGLAKGARRLKNPFETSLDLLASIKLTFIRKNSDALDLFTEAKLARRFRPNSRNLRGLYAGYYVVELLDAMTEDYDPAPKLWRLTDLTLASLAKRGRVGSRVFAYEAYLLDSFGEFPSVRNCVECGQELPLDRVDNLARKIWFENDRGGVVCRNCLARRRTLGLVSTTIGALKALETARDAARNMLLYNVAFEQNLEDQYERARNAPATTLDQIGRNAEIVRESLDSETLEKLETLDPGARRDLRELINRYIMRIVRRPLRTANWLRYATGEDGAPTRDDVKTLELSEA